MLHFLAHATFDFRHLAASKLLLIKKFGPRKVSLIVSTNLKNERLQGFLYRHSADFEVLGVPFKGNGPKIVHLCK